MNKRLQGRIAVVTGASRGIGMAVATALGAEGAHVVLIARTQGGLEEAADAIEAQGGTTTLTPMDLTDFPAIDRLGAAMAERHGHIDILIGNAGALGVLSPTGHVDPPVWENTFNVNFHANWRLIRSLDPLLRQSDAGRLLFTSLTCGFRALPYWSAYACGKAALDMLVKTYAREVAKTPIRANLMDPGSVATQLRRQAFPGADFSGLSQPDDVAPAFVEAVLPSFNQTGKNLKAY